MPPVPLIVAWLLGGAALHAAAQLPTAPAANAAAAASAPPAAPPLALEPSRAIAPPPRSGDDAPLHVEAGRVTTIPDVETEASDGVVLRRRGVVVRTERLRYDHAEDLLRAEGHVRIEHEGAVYEGPVLELRVQRFEGYFDAPSYTFTQLDAGGSAARVEFLGPGRVRAVDAIYTSCPRDGVDEPDWVLRARRVEIDFDANEGVAEGGQLRFLGRPILALPVLSFPVGDARKTGWLPPTVSLDNRSGLEVSAPFYWNIAENRDATLAPRVLTRRGFGVDAEFRYLEPKYGGTVALNWLPIDRVADRQRAEWQWLHAGRLGGGFAYSADIDRVSDDAYWKDFASDRRGFTPRLLPARLALERPWQWSRGSGTAYLRTTQWQVLQASEAFIVSPYERSPQLGVTAAASFGAFDVATQAEVNRFTLPRGQETTTARPTGERAHWLSAVSRPFREPGWWVVPKLSFNAAGYRTAYHDAVGTSRRDDDARVIPTFSVDTGAEFARRTAAFGRDLVQTLEPRLLYVNTPYREQRHLPNYDAAGKDFNFVSLFTDNAFSGVDRVSDAHQVTAGVTTRLVDAATGEERLRLGFAQRYLLRSQRVTAQPDGTADGEPLTQRWSDALLVGSTNVLPAWTLDAAVQYSPDLARSVRSVLGARWAPGPFRTVGATYRYARGLSEQVELGWQWPVAGAARELDGDRAAAATGGRCSGAWYSVGRVVYSLRDSRFTDSVLGLEYDAGCWIARVVALRLSTGLSEATTRLALQLEFTGLSRLNVGANPLKVLKDNIPGYRMLRDDDGESPLASSR